jgi:hypothetical protein
MEPMLKGAAEEAAVPMPEEAPVGGPEAPSSSAQHRWSAVRAAAEIEQRQGAAEGRGGCRWWSRATYGWTQSMG